MCVKIGMNVTVFGGFVDWIRLLRLIGLSGMKILIVICIELLSLLYVFVSYHLKQKGMILSILS